MQLLRHSHSAPNGRLLARTLLLLLAISQASALTARQLTKRVWGESDALDLTKRASSTSQKFVVAQ